MSRNLKVTILFSTFIGLNMVVWYEVLGLVLVIPVSVLMLVLLLSDRKGNAKK